MRAPIHHLAVRTIAAGLLLAGAAAAEAASRFVERVPAHGTRTHSLYVGRDDNWLTVRGDGTTDLDCWVYQDGTLVDSDTDDSDYCILETPGIGTHRLVIKNYGNVYNDYTLRQRYSLR